MSQACERCGLSNQTTHNLFAKDQEIKKLKMELDSFKKKDNQLWEIQKKFNDEFFATKGGWPQSEEELTKWSKEFAIHLIKEITEVLDQLSFKMHRSHKDGINEFNIREELIDCQKFLWGWMQLWSMDHQGFYDEFLRKSAIVSQRFEQERTLPNLVAHPVAIIDIDGVLSDYPNCFYDWLKGELIPHIVVSRATAKTTYEEASIIQKEQFKAAYRQSGAKAYLAVLPGAVELLKLIESKGLKIILFTTRPYNKYFKIYSDTLTWLNKYGFPYSGIIWAADKGYEVAKTFRNVSFAIDDSEDNIKRFREAKIPCIKLDPGNTDCDTAALLRVAQKTERIDDLAYAWADYQKALLVK